ncbi:MAG: hypothetical protein Ct9H300mP23_12020 [Nitrospinota bacterium]|nr:MAG: hypothetical protein Ct9H300mP23_12020 [Nitrospinota bacterium]
MDRLVGKNILIIIPKDYYMESEFDPVFEAMTAEGATVLVASSKLKEAVGMKKAVRIRCIDRRCYQREIYGRSYVSPAKGVRQVKGVFQGDSNWREWRKNLFMERRITAIASKRPPSSGMVVAAIGSAVPCLGKADLSKASKSQQNPVIKSLKGNRRCKRILSITDDFA